MIKEKNVWRENSNFIHFKVNVHGQILGLGAKIKIGEKVRSSEHCAALPLLCARFISAFKRVLEIFFAELLLSY